MQNLEEVLQKFCMKHDEPKLKLKYALTFVVTAGDLGRSEMEKWSHVESRGQSKLWDLPGVVEMCDRRLANDYCTEMKIFKNLIPLCNSAQNTVFFYLINSVFKSSFYLFMCLGSIRFVSIGQSYTKLEYTDK